uniref:FCP1 homology domain-containing protein n=1 Tax=Electrophorus electricus TaxID=8005 RepID=A0A4W4FY70_ELEEL
MSEWSVFSQSTISNDLPEGSLAYYCTISTTDPILNKLTNEVLYNLNGLCPVLKISAVGIFSSKYSITGAVFSPEQCVFGYSTTSPLSKDKENDKAFSPCTFIKNIPNQSQHSRPATALQDIPPKTRSTPAATMVLDLDETLVFSSLSMIDDAEYTFNTCFQDQEYKVYVVLRPYVKEFLQSMAKHFEMFVYTSAKKEYAEMIVGILDPKKKLFRYRLYQDDCACVHGHYIKDLAVLERDLSKTVILDNAPHTFPYHLTNMIPIKSWCGDQEDKELQRLIPYLEKLVQADDFRTVLKRRTDPFHRLLSED